MHNWKRFGELVHESILNMTYPKILFKKGWHVKHEKKWKLKICFCSDLHCYFRLFFLQNSLNFTVSTLNNRKAKPSTTETSVGCICLMLKFLLWTKLFMFVICKRKKTLKAMKSTWFSGTKMKIYTAIWQIILKHSKTPKLIENRDYDLKSFWSCNHIHNLQWNALSHSDITAHPTRRTCGQKNRWARFSRAHVWMFNTGCSTLCSRMSFALLKLNVVVYFRKGDWWRALCFSWCFSMTSVIVSSRIWLHTVASWVDCYWKMGSHAITGGHRSLSAVLSRFAVFACGR